MGRWARWKVVKICSSFDAGLFTQALLGVVKNGIVQSFGELEFNNIGYKKGYLFFKDLVSETDTNSYEICYEILQ